jgi:hypothetical protein
MPAKTYSSSRSALVAKHAARSVGVEQPLPRTMDEGVEQPLDEGVEQPLPRTMDEVKALGGKQVGDVFSYGALPEDVGGMDVISVLIPGAGCRSTLFRRVLSVMLADGTCTEYLGFTIPEAVANARAARDERAAEKAAAATLRADHALTCARRALSKAMSEAKREECSGCAAAEEKVAAAMAAEEQAAAAMAAAMAAEQVAMATAAVSKGLYEAARLAALNPTDAAKEN